MKKQIKEIFSVLSGYYEKEVDVISPYNVDYERPAMISLFPDELVKKSILDAGCAAGWYTNYLWKKGAHVTAVDFCPEMVEATKRRCPNAKVFVHDMGETFPFPDRSFEIVLSSLVLHFLKDWESILKEVHRILHTNGVFYFSVVHPSAVCAPPFESQNYFETELVHEIWDKKEKTDVFFYRRSMQKILNDLLPFFTIDQLVEPQPQKSFEEKDPKMYLKLMRHPHFLVVKARKKE